MPNSIARTAMGRYTVYLDGVHTATGGNVQVASSYGMCRVADRENINGGSALYVACRDYEGGFIDEQFAMTFTEDVGITGDLYGKQPAAYLWANKPTEASYQPKAAFRYSSADTVPVVTRSGVGMYEARLPGMRLGGFAHVTAYGPGNAQCQLGSIRKDGLPQKIGVLCFKPNGDAVDSQFYLTYAR